MSSGTKKKTGQEALRRENAEEVARLRNELERLRKTD